MRLYVPKKHVEKHVLLHVCKALFGNRLQSFIMELRFGQQFFFHAPLPILPAPCTSPPSYLPLLFSMSSLIAVGDAIAATGTRAIAGDSMPTAKTLLLCYCYFVTFCLYNEKTPLSEIIYLINNININNFTIR